MENKFYKALYLIFSRWLKTKGFSHDINTSAVVTMTFIAHA